MLPEGQTKTELQHSAKVAFSKCKKAKERVDKHIAHADWDTRQSVVQIGTVTDEDIRGGFDAIGSFIRLFGKRMLDTGYSLNIIGQLGSDEVEFLEALYEGVEAKRERRELRKRFLDARDREALGSFKKYPDWVCARHEIDWDKGETL